MLEQTQNQGYKDFRKRLTAELRTSGFYEVEMMPAMCFVNRDDLYNHLDGTDTQIPGEQVVQNNHQMLVYAKK